jgi:hypothetical protein
VISEAGNDPKVVGLVYITAFAPDKGESVATLIKDPPPGAPVPPILPPQETCHASIPWRESRRPLDLNHRPLGYENGRHPLSAVESITPKATLTVQNRFWRLKCRRF